MPPPPFSLSSPLLPFSPLPQAHRRMSVFPGTGTGTGTGTLLLCCEIGSWRRSGFVAAAGVSFQRNGLSVLSGSEPILLRPVSSSFRRRLFRRRNLRISASWIATSQIASQAFTWGTVAVLPFYTLMVLAPNSKLTRRAMESNAPYVLLGILYAYLLYLSWTPETLKCMFASKYWLPELPGIARMFSNELTVASAWIHLLAVDLFAARQVFHDGLRNNVETRHSVSMCLLFCPIGIVAHAVTKVLTKSVKHQH